MDYLEIILTGFFDDNNREHLENYFRRECKKAEIEFYEPMEFYKGCFRVIEEWEQHLKDKVFKRKQELYMMLTGAKDGTIKHSNTETKPVEELNNDLISYCNEELKNEQVNGIGSLSFSVHLYSVTKGRAAYNMPYYEVLQIKNTIVKLVKDILKSETLPPQQTETKTEILETIKKETVKNLSKLEIEDILSEIKSSENKFWKGLPMEQVVKHFEIMTSRKNKNGSYFLTPEQLITFLRKGFLTDTEQPTQKINCTNGEKGFVIKRFYEFFDLAVSKYCYPQRKEKFISLFTDCFDNWEPNTIEPFFKPNKTKESW